MTSQWSKTGFDTTILHYFSNAIIWLCRKHPLYIKNGPKRPKMPQKLQIRGSGGRSSQVSLLVYIYKPRPHIGAQGTYMGPGAIYGPRAQAGAPFCRGKTFQERRSQFFLTPQARSLNLYYLDFAAACCCLPDYHRKSHLRWAKRLVPRIHFVDFL